MTDLPESFPAPPGGEAAAPRNGKERMLVFIVVFLGLLIVAGLAAVILRVIYLSSTGPAQRTSNGEPLAATPAGSSSKLALPAGAVVRSVSVGGDRLAVHYDAPSGTGVAVVDLGTGGVVRTIEVTPGASPR